MELNPNEGGWVVEDTELRSSEEIHPSLKESELLMSSVNLDPAYRIHTTLIVSGTTNAQNVVHISRNRGFLHRGPTVDNTPNLNQNFLYNSWWHPTMLPWKPGHLLEEAQGWYYSLYVCKLLCYLVIFFMQSLQDRSTYWGVHVCLMHNNLLSVHSFVTISFFLFSVFFSLFFFF